MTNDDAVLLSFGDSLLLKSDLDLLAEPNWINDKLIGFAYDPSLVQIIRFAGASDLQVLLDSLNLPTKQFVFVPVNDHSDTTQVGGMHWSLLVYVRSRQEFQHYDSSRGTNQAVAKKLMDKLQPFVQAPKGKLRFVEMDCSHQENSYDCGMFVLANTEHLIREFVECVSLGVGDVVNQQTVSDKRKHLAQLITSLAKDSTEEERSINFCKGTDEAEPVTATS
ncbi:sentrin-specific protease 8 [Elysia marginata]|uniref:Sentrin-specific protease 8 n=1 Tax=Elysia marginata TaxID=1093978 RepID=A0AAV4FDR4_9GAST|nr:sentrin-specific protease 8 [Elysia marginata]